MPGNVRDNAALLLASGRSIVDAAQEVGVNEKTLRRWKRDAQFLRQVATLRGELLSAGMGKLVSAAGTAADTLTALLISKNEGIKLSAARTILATGGDLYKVIELQGELAKVQSKMDELEVLTKEMDSHEASRPHRQSS